MRILIVVHEFPCDGGTFHGGIATFYQNLSMVLKRNGNDVAVVTLSGKYNDSIIWNGIEVDRVKIPSIIYRMSRKFRTKTIEGLACAFLVRCRIDRIAGIFKPEVIQYANFKGLSYFRPVNIPSVVRMSSDNTLWREAYKEQYDYQTAFNRVISEDRFELKAIRKADAIFAPSCLLAEITGDRIDREVAAIKSLYVPVSGDNSVFDSAGLEDKRFMLFYGAVCPMKGCLAIGKVLTDFFDRYPDMLFVFIGRNYHVYNNDDTKSVSTKEYIEQANQKYVDNILFFDNIERECIVPFIKRAEACVFPSRIDNIPNTCLEAMYEKKVVIGTFNSSIDEILEDGRSGLLIDIDDCEGLLSALLRVMEMNSDERTAMGNEAFKMLSNYSEQKIYNQMMNYYENVLKKKLGDVD